MVRGLGIVALSALLHAAAAPAAELTLPHTSQSNASAVDVALRGAEVVVTCAARDDVGLEVRSRRPEGAESAELEIAQRGATLRVSGPPSGAGPSEIVLELSVPADLPVAISGSDLVILRTCTAPASDRSRTAAPAAPPAGGQPTTPPLSSFELEHSAVDYRGPGSARFAGSGNELTLIDTSDDLEVSFTDGFVDSTRHRGNLVLDTVSSATALHAPAGRLAANLDGGRLTVIEAAGEAVIELDDAGLDVEDHRGTLSVTARIGDVSVRRGTMSELSITGEDAAVRLAGCTATGTVDLSRGTLGIDGWVGRLTLQGDSGADLEVAGVEGDVVLSLEDAAVELHGVTGHTRATAASSEVTVSALKSISLTAQACTVGVADVPEVTLIRLAGGELDMTSSEVRGKQKLELLGEVWARVGLPTPCEVHLAGEGAAEADVDVRGCDLRGGAGPGTQRPRRRLGEAPPAVLEVTLEAGSNLRVEGRSS